jgi:hypothetical protein
VAEPVQKIILTIVLLINILKNLNIVNLIYYLFQPSASFAYHFSEKIGKKSKTDGSGVFNIK